MRFGDEGSGLWQPLGVGALQLSSAQTTHTPNGCCVLTYALQLQEPTAYFTALTVWHLLSEPETGQHASVRHLSTFQQMSSQ
jgi:hypothetical protein